MALKVHKANKNATKGKKQAWKKGQSCSYNPSFKKHRELAKSKRFTFVNQGEGKLTQHALAMHDKVNASKDDDKDCEEMTVTDNTFVTTFTNCVNPSFNQLLRRWRSTSSLHKETLAVLAAVTEVLKANGGKETETEYFAALMTTLDAVTADEAITAVFTLLNMVVRRLPVAVLKSRFELATSVYTRLLKKYINSDYNALLRNLMNCLYYFLKVIELSAWSSTVLESYNVILEFAVHQKPKVRKAAQHIVCCLLCSSSETAEDLKRNHPAAASTAQFCIKMLESGAGCNFSSSTFHVLGLMRNVIAVFPKSSLKLCCETLLRAMTLSNALATSGCLKTLHGLFLAKPKAENLPADLNIRIINALYDYQPNENDNEPLIIWIQVMECAFINLHRLDVKNCINHLPAFFKRAVACWLSSKEEVRSAAALTLVNIINSCINPLSIEVQQFLLASPVDNPISKMFHCVENALNYQYHDAWKQVLTVLAAFFDVMGRYCYSFMIKCLKSLADMRDSYNFPYKLELDKTFGIAVQQMGPDIVLQAIPLQITGENDKLDFPRSWLLPVLRDYTKETKLKFFIDYFLPLAEKVKQRATQCEQEKRIVESKTYDVIHSQIWSLLPGICTRPTDLKQSFRCIARKLGDTLVEDKSLRMIILSALRILVNQNIENEENKQEIARFDKNYLPILFNLYTTESKDKSEEGVRLAVYETIKIFMQIASKEQVCKRYDEAMMVLENPKNLFTQHALLDLCRAMLPYMNEFQIQKLYEYCKPLLQHKNHTIQKKCYSVINELCSNQNSVCKQFVESSLEDLRALLLTSLSSSSSPSKAMRLNCLGHLVQYLPDANKEFVIAVIPEAALCTKEASSKARAVAFKLLVEIGYAFKRWKPNSSAEALREYMQYLLAGLAGNPHMMSATVLAIGRVMYEFKGDFDSAIIHLMIENICLLLTSKSREVVTSAMSFVKILFAAVDTIDLAQHVESLVQSIASISEDNQRHFRFKAKELFTRLIRKFGYEMISKLVPARFQKMLTNVRKIEARKMRKKKSGEIIDDSDDEDTSKFKPKTDLIDDVLEDLDDDDEEPGHEKAPKSNKKVPEGTRKKRKSEATFIGENAESEIIDFLDPAVNRKILGSKPEKVEKRTHDSGFEMTEDGRLIINDKIEGKNKKRKLDLEGISETDKISKKKKSKLGELSDDDDDLLADIQAVTKGIHRTLGTSEKKIGEQYKAKKAGGDVKKGKLEPYAYIPLNNQLLNKRKRSKLKGQFKGLVGAAKHGARKGTKQKAKLKRKNKF